MRWGIVPRAVLHALLSDGASEAPALADLLELSECAVREALAALQRAGAVQREWAGGIDAWSAVDASECVKQRRPRWRPTERHPESLVCIMELP